MKRKTISGRVLMVAMLLLFMTISALQAQTTQEGTVGINTNTPQVSLDVKGFPSNTSRFDGIRAPRITGAQLRAKTYTAAQDGAIVYVTDADPTPAGQTLLVKCRGYYYFDKTTGSSGVWIPFKVCSELPSADNCGTVSSATTVTDVEGNVYETVSIGTQTWMASNLKTTKYNDGTAITNITDNATWSNSTTPAYCWYDNDEAANKCTYGTLYNWYAVDAGSNGGKNICPTGWHVPSDDEWKALEKHLGMTQAQVDATGNRGSDQGSQLAGYANLWVDGVLETNANFGTSGFAAVPGGTRSPGGVSFHYLGEYGYWWSTSEYSNIYAWFRYLRNDYSSVQRYYYDKSYGFSVRCLRD